MANRSTITLDYSPRGPFQSFHKRKQRRAVLVCHRRAGKTVATIVDLIINALSCSKPNARFAYIGPYKNQCKDIAWDYLVKFVRPFGPLVKINNQDLSVTFKNGAKIRLFGADEPDNFRGQYFDGVVLDEYGDMKPRVFTEIIAPALADRDGWAVFIGTPKGHNEFYKTREIARSKPDEYFYLELKASESGFLPDLTLAEAREEMSRAEYDQEYECSFEAALQGSFYADQISTLSSKGHMTNIPWIQNIEVHTAWDIGLDTVAIWFWQIVSGEVRVIDYYEVSNTKLPTIVDYLHSLPYEYGQFYLPHDATHDRVNTDKTILETLWDYGFDCRQVPKLRIVNGINAVRKVLPYCYFDLNACHTGLESLRMYSKKWSQQLSMYTDMPKHDKYSHGADAFRYMCTSIRDEHLTSDAPPLQQARKVEPQPVIVKKTVTIEYCLPPPDQFARRNYNRLC